MFDSRSVLNQGHFILRNKCYTLKTWDSCITSHHYYFAIWPSVQAHYYINVRKNKLNSLCSKVQSWDLLCVLLLFYGFVMSHTLHLYSYTKLNYGVFLWVTGENSKSASVHLAKSKIKCRYVVFLFLFFFGNVTTNHVTLTYLSFWKCDNHGHNVWSSD